MKENKDEFRHKISKMRKLEDWERMKRGCAYCLHVQETRALRGVVCGHPAYYCPFDVCPIHETDHLRNYLRDWDVPASRNWVRLFRKLEETENENR